VGKAHLGGERGEGKTPGKDKYGGALRKGKAGSKRGRKELKRKREKRLHGLRLSSVGMGDQGLGRTVKRKKKKRQTDIGEEGKKGGGRTARRERSRASRGQEVRALNGSAKGSVKKGRWTGGCLKQYQISSMSREDTKGHWRGSPCERLS